MGLFYGVMNYLLLICSLTPLGLVYSQRVYSHRNCSAVDNWLPCDEVDAIVSFFDYLYLDIDTDAISSRESACNQSNSKNYFSCNCSVHPSDKQCHVDTIILNLNIEGKINEDVGKLKYLTRLDLFNNKLSGLIPESLGNLSRLLYLDLSTNKLSGKIPHAVGNLSSLEVLILRYNNLTGTIPAALGNLVNLQYLYLTENQLVGPLPPRLPTNLRDLSLSSNNLTGPIPDTYRGLVRLEIFDVSGNHLDGPIPSFIANWSYLSSLKLSGNHFESIAPEIFGMSSLSTLIISDVPNNGDFKLPNMTALTNLNTLVLRNCSITGHLHSTISMLSDLNKLDLSNNNLTGDLSALKNLSSTVILLQNNSLTGRIPPELLGRQKDDDNILRDFSYNGFTEVSNEQHGKLTYTKPQSMDKTLIRRRHCPKSKHKYYHSLYINCGGGQVAINKTLVYEADNSTSNWEMYGRWGYSCSGSYSSETLSLSRPVPSYYLENSTCGVSGSSSDLYQESRLCPTSLRYFAFCLRKGEYEVTLHFRDTVFASDDDYTSYGKRVFDVYVQGNRNLTNFYLRKNINRPGNVSEQAIHTHVDDDGFLDIRLYWPGLGSSISPNALHGPIISAISVNPLFTVGLKTWEKAVIGATSALFLLLVSVLWWTGVIGDKKLREKRIAIRGKQYTVKQVVQGTQNFNPKNEIGAGGFGTVYKSQLPSGGAVVAVKKLSSQSHQKKQQVQSEVYTLKQLKHDNIVELFDGYSDPTRNLHLLVYEYMEHKSIAHVLFDPNSELQLNWTTRYNICIGMAKGLEYLHNSRLKIVHRNIKSTNILLDENMKAKISDLGLAKLFEEENPYVSIGSTSQMYRAPEYATRNAITDKADVYSFGVVLLEIVSGKSNADYKDAQEAEFLLDKACVLQSKGRLIDLVDGKLLSDQTYDRKQAIKVLDLAMMCLDQSHKLRPNMSQVVAVLEDHISIQQLSKETNPST